MNMNSQISGNRKKNYIMALAFVIAGVVLDQFTKSLAAAHLKGKNPFVILDGVFELQYLENRGAAFGLFQNQHLFFFASVVLMTVAVIIFFPAGMRRADYGRGIRQLHRPYKPQVCHRLFLL